MIKNDRQYAVTKRKLAVMEKYLAMGFEVPVPEIVRETREEQLQDLISELRGEMEEYEKLKSTKPEELEIHSVDDLVAIPLRYRIASHMSVEDFSRKVDVNVRQIHRYEATNYSNASIPTLKRILEKLGIALDGHIVAA